MRNVLVVLFLSLATSMSAQQKQADVLTFSNGDQLTGTFLRAVGDSVVFKSDMAGELTIPYTKIKELKTQRSYAVIEKGKRITAKTPDAEIPQGAVIVTDSTITVAKVSAQAPRQVPVANAAYIVDDATFQKELRGKTPFLQGWNGAVTLGASLIKATQNDYAANVGIALIRAIPQAAYLAPRNKTTADFTFNYGEIKTPTLTGNTVAKTDIYHAGAERDQYLSGRLFALGRLAYDHNYSQGLKLAQTYGGGLGYTVIDKPKEQLDLKADLHYTRESFYVASQNQNLIGVGIGDNYLLHLHKTLLLTQFATANPAFNNPDAFAAIAGINLAAPISKRFAASAGLTDSYIHNPGFLSPGIRSNKNSVQFIVGLTYALQ